MQGAGSQAKQLAILERAQKEHEGGVPGSNWLATYSGGSTISSGRGQRVGFPCCWEIAATRAKDRVCHLLSVIKKFDEFVLEPGLEQRQDRPESPLHVLGQARARYPREPPDRASVAEVVFKLGSGSKTQGPVISPASRVPPFSGAMQSHRKLDRSRAGAKHRLPSRRRPTPSPAPSSPRTRKVVPMSIQ